MEEWKGFDLIRESLQSFDRSRIPFCLLQPKTGNRQNPCILLLHGITASKEEQWLEPNHYTKGEGLTLALLEQGYAVAAIDARMHGERKEREYADFEENFAHVQEHMHSNYRKNIKDIVSVVKHLQKREEINNKKLALLGFSMGAIFSLDMAARHSRNFTTVIAAALPVGVNDGNGYHGKLLKRIKLPFLHLAGSKDQWITEENSKKAFALIPSREKQFILYDSNHALPDEYIGDVLKWLGKYLG